MKLDFSWKDLSHIVIDDSSGVLECDISWCNLSKIPDDIFTLDELIVFKCFENNIENLEYDFSNLKNLKVLELGNCHIKNISDDVLVLENLEVFNIAYNGVENITTNIYKLSNLKAFELSSNNLSSLPKEFYDLPSLEWLNLTCNKIDILDKDILNLKNLKVLIIDNKVIENSLDIIDALKLNNVSIFNEFDEQK
jgi:Leucine-rich repeat (LRR) protein